jgi:hypothetical protein
MVAAGASPIREACKHESSSGCSSSGVTPGCRSCDLWDDVVEVAGSVDVVSFLSEVVVPVLVEVAVGFDGA